jgi:hypothetical protein
MFGHMIAIAALLSASLAATKGPPDCVVHRKSGTKSRALRAMARIDRGHGRGRGQEARHGATSREETFTRPRARSNPTDPKG